MTPAVFALGEMNTISLGNNGADGSYTRSHLVFTLPVHSLVDEKDILRGIQNVQGFKPRGKRSMAMSRIMFSTGAAANDVLDGGLGNDTLGRRARQLTR